MKFRRLMFIAVITGAAAMAFAFNGSRAFADNPPHSNEPLATPQTSSFTENGAKEKANDKHADAPKLKTAKGGKTISGQYIVTLREGENPRSVAAIAKVSPKWVYESALNGFHR